MNVIFYTLGCKVNQYETEAMREEFLKRGHTCNRCDSPDAVIINSCSVTAESDRKTRQLLNRVKKENPNAVITLTGCMVQAFPEKSKLLPANVIIGNKDILNTVLKTEEAFLKKENFFYVEEHKSGDKYNTLSLCDFGERTRAYMKIEDGCDRFCSYCIIPYARGRVRSRSLEDIRAEAAALAKNGYREIVLVGINLSAYGMGTEFNICDAVDTVCENEDILRVRLGSLEPDHITDQMLIRLKNQPKFCPQFHLSLQSGCDETLKRMNRHYDSAFYLDLITRIRKIFDSAAITTDIMVGFAGETDEEFEKSLKFAETACFSRAHIFCYSRREGTVAAALKSQVTQAVKQERSKQMIAVTEKSETEFLKAHIGKTLSVLFESDGGGYTRDYSRVKTPGIKIKEGTVRNVKITGIDGNLLIGEVI